MFWTRVRVPPSPLISDPLAFKKVYKPLRNQGFSLFWYLVLSHDVLLNLPIIGRFIGRYTNRRRLTTFEIYQWREKSFPYQLGELKPSNPPTRRKPFSTVAAFSSSFLLYGTIHLASHFLPQSSGGLSIPSTVSLA